MIKSCYKRKYYTTIKLDELSSDANMWMQNARWKKTSLKMLYPMLAN